MFLVPVSRRGTDLSRLFDDAFDRFFTTAPTTPAATGAATPALDVSESQTAWTVKMDLPGVAREDVKVAIDGNVVSVQAQSRQDIERSEGERVIYRERSSASYARRFSLPAEVDQGQSGARLENGVLTLTLGKRSASPSSHLTVN
ncbi:MAG: Hsp20/alpha crystallin family protein [Rubrivivax sp.]